MGGAQAINPDPTITPHPDQVAHPGEATLTLTIAQTTDGQTGGTITKWCYVIDRVHAGKLTAWFQGNLVIHPVASE